MVGIIADEVKFFKKDKSTTQHSGKGVGNINLTESKIKDYLPDYGKPWFKVPHLLRLNSILLIVSLTSTNNGFDGSLLNAFQSIPDWAHAMGNPKGAILGALANGIVFGSCLGAPFAPWISDRFGRRNAISIGNAIMIVGSVIQSAAGTWLTVDGESAEGFTEKKAFAMFLIARIIIGFGNTISVISSPPLISELTYPSHRQPMTAFFNSNWYLGAIIAAWVSFGTRNMEHNWSWRIPSIFQGFFPILQISLIYLVPESPRYLISKGRFEEARAIILKHHAGGDEQVGGDLVDFEMSEISLAIEQERVANDSSYSDFLKTPGNKKRLFLICFMGLATQLSGNGLVSYYLNLVLVSIGVTSTDQQLIFNGGLMMYNYAISIGINLLVFQNVKRRLVFITSFAMMMSVYVIWTVLSALNQQRNFEDTGLAKGVMAMIFLYYLAYNLGLNGLPFLYVTEITPFILRARAVNIMVLVQQITLIYNGFVNPVAMDAIQWKYYIVFCVVLCFELLVAYLTIVETSGRTLEEVAEVFGEGIEDFKPSVHVGDHKKAGLSHVEHVDTHGSVSSPSSTSDKNNNVVSLHQV